MRVIGWKEGGKNKVAESLDKYLIWECAHIPNKIQYSLFLRHHKTLESIMKSFSLHARIIKPLFARFQFNSRNKLPTILSERTNAHTTQRERETWKKFTFFCANIKAAFLCVDILMYAESYGREKKCERLPSSSPSMLSSSSCVWWALRIFISIDRRRQKRKNKNFCSCKM